MSRKKNSKKVRQKNFSTLKEHKVQGKTLIPPFLTIQQLQPISWINNRLPEMLWAALLLSQLPRPGALGIFREVAEYVRRFRDANPPYDITHTGLTKQQPSALRGILDILASTHERREALRPLLLLQELPVKEAWAVVLRTTTTTQDWDPLMIAVGRTLDHQSQEATDCRWARLICRLTAGKLMLNSEQLAKELLHYPGCGDMTAVHPMIRALEGAIATHESTDQTQRDWPEKFWSQCLSDTLCYPLVNNTPGLSAVVGTTQSRVRQVYELLIKHSCQTRKTSATDARHDTAFGVALYCLSILQELLHIGASQSVTARIAIRTIAECFITLTYLTKKDDPELWQSYRVFGAGQAKLAYLKIEELGEAPRFVDAEALERLANEDMWQEFLPIELGHWEKANLRKMSEEATVKDEYDRYYSWTSTFSHGHWGAVRDVVYDTCGNPLHRLHRIPRSSARALPDVIPDACRLVDKILEVLSICYPNFTHQVTVHDP